MPTRKAEEISGDDNDDTSTPVAKKLKSSPTDLMILVGEEKYEYHCHGIYMAFQSDFIDAALASPMRESQTNVIALPDITPSIWGVMMKIIDSPAGMNNLKITMSQIVLAVEKFDKYQFVNGIASCSARISAEFHKLAPVFHALRAKAELHLDSVIKTALQCSNLGLDDAMPSIYAFFKLMLSMPMDGKHYFGGLMFNEEQLKLLAPLIAKGKLVGDRWTEEEILCPLFPKHYLATAMTTYEEKRFGHKHRRTPLKIATLWLKKTKTQKSKVAVLQKESATIATPKFHGSPTTGDSSIPWGGDLDISRIYVQKFPDRNWVVKAVGEEEDGLVVSRILWRCPMSSNFTSFPPRKGWVKADPSVPAGSLRVELEEKIPTARTPPTRPVAVDQR